MMSRLRELYEEAQERDILVINGHFSGSKKAACLCGVGNNIVLDRAAIKSEDEERELLGHEVEHIESGNLYTLDVVASIRPQAARLSRIKMEGITRRGWILKDLPPERLQIAIDEVGAQFCAIAEYCGNTERFVREAFELYESKGIRFDVSKWAE